MNNTRLESIFLLIDQSNAEDPNLENEDGKSVPKELLYGQRMTKMLEGYVDGQPSEPLAIAARAQHICRWEIPREKYPMDRTGYLKWRTDLKKFHADKTSSLMQQLDYDARTIERVSFLLQKKQLKRDSGTQILEDIVCLVFLKYYFEDFSKKHSDEKIIDILQKTWRKMSEKGKKQALTLKFSPAASDLIKKALA